MKCDRCGRDNPPHVRFCLDCGNRMASAEVPLAPPTPRGMEPLDAGSTQIMNDSAAPPPEHRVSRPPAPDFNFLPRQERRGLTCGSCGAENPGR